jgi:site-specific recombinase XerD
MMDLAKTDRIADRLPALAGPLLDQAHLYASAAKAQSTWRKYAGDFKRFETWCAAQSLRALPALPETLALYLTHLAQQGRRVATMTRALVAISQRHVLSGHPSPRSHGVVREVLKGIRRSLGVAQTTKSPLLPHDLVKMISTLPNTLLGQRDRSLLLLGFFAALRRSELVGLNVSDLEFVREGLVVHLRRCKTDQEGQGRKIAVPYQSQASVCPVRTIQAWLQVSGITEGAVFRGTRGRFLTKKRLDGGDVARRVKAGAQRVSLDASRFAGHSLRAGFVTAAALNGAPERSIAITTNHKNLEMLRRYIRNADLFREPAARWIQLRAP